MDSGLAPYGAPRNDSGNSSARQQPIGCQMTESPLVDAHVHVFTQDMPLIDNPRHAPTYSFTVEQLLATMDAHGVQFGVIAAASPWGDYNDYTLAALRAHPRLRGTVILKPSVERLVLDTMSRDGVVGVRLPV